MSAEPRKLPAAVTNRARHTALFLLTSKPVLTGRLRAATLPPRSGRAARRIGLGLTAGFLQVGAHGSVPRHARTNRHVDITPDDTPVTTELQPAEDTAHDESDVGP